VLLDLMLPRRGGTEVLATLRKRGIQTPVLILTAKDTIEDRVRGLDLGGDDYLVKPFAFPELLARIRALLRRGTSEAYSDAQVVALCDPAILRLALTNLLHNAISYTPEHGAIRVRVRANSGNEAGIEISDSGPGIPAAHRERIFQRFYRIDESRSRASGGVGLGLAIAKWAVEANDGRIEIDTQDGRGSTFRVVLARSD